MHYLKRTVQLTFAILVILQTSLFVYYRQRNSDNEFVQVPDKLQANKDDKIIEDERINAYSKFRLGSEITATPVSVTTYLEDIFISVKTTKHYHKSRLPVILKTWFQLAKEQIWFFTDTEEEEFNRVTNGHMINTNCSASHNRKALCCKMSVEFDTFLDSNKKWFCHFDDDNYVNVPKLVDMLSNYNPQKDWYLGKPSIRTPLEILSREHPDVNKLQQNISFWFATGGAGFCLSKSLALKMVAIARCGC